MCWRTLAACPPSSTNTGFSHWVPVRTVPHIGSSVSAAPAAHGSALLSGRRGVTTHTGSAELGEAPRIDPESVDCFVSLLHFLLQMIYVSPKSACCVSWEHSVTGMHDIVG